MFDRSGVCATAQVGKQLYSCSIYLSSPSTLTWALWIDLRLSGLSQALYLLPGPSQWPLRVSGSPVAGLITGERVWDTLKWYKQ